MCISIKFKPVFVLLGLIVLFSVGCKKADTKPSDYAYYEFTAEDQSRMPFKAGQAFRYRNQKGEEQVFEINRIEEKLRSQYVKYVSGFFGGYSDTNYYTDSRWFYFHSKTTPKDSFVIYTFRQPNAEDSADWEPRIKYQSHLVFRIANFPKWMGFKTGVADVSYPIEVPAEGSIPHTQPGFPTFDDVHVFEAGFREPYEWPEFGDWRTIRTVYYSDRVGVIRYDDTNENQWLLIP